MNTPQTDPLAVETITLLRDLVAIDSVNPSLVPGAAGESEIADFILTCAQEQGLEVERLEATPGRPSVLVSSHGHGHGPQNGKTLMLCGHTDTVGVGQVTGPLDPVVDGDRIHGRGVYDMKAGVVAALIACREADRLNLPGRVVVAAVADEEHSSHGVQEVLRNLHPDAAIVTEPTELTVATAHRGFVWTQITTVLYGPSGDGAHAVIEWASASSTIDCTHTLVKVTTNFCGPSRTLSRGV